MYTLPSAIRKKVDCPSIASAKKRIITFSSALEKKNRLSTSECCGVGTTAGIRVRRPEVVAGSGEGDPVHRHQRYQGNQQLHSDALI